VWCDVGSGAPTNVAIDESVATPLEVTAYTASPMAVSDVRVLLSSATGPKIVAHMEGVVDVWVNLCSWR
jgi:hypothetical protein